MSIKRISPIGGGADDWPQVAGALKANSASRRAAKKTRPGSIVLQEFFRLHELGEGFDSDDEGEAPIQLCHVLKKDRSRFGGSSLCKLPTLWFGGLVTEEHIERNAGRVHIEITCPICLRLLAAMIEKYLRQMKTGFPKAWVLK